MNENEGTKLIFVYPPPPAVAKSKACEIYERNKITFRYSSVMDAYTQMQKDIEKLESFIRILRFKPNYGIPRLTVKESLTHSIDPVEGYIKSELHSLSTYSINVISKNFPFT